jgi:ferric-dicitrate binding protein FerR (iron transport regulator)
MTQGGAHDGAEGGRKSEEEGEHVTRRKTVRRRRRMRALALFLTIALFVAVAITLAALDRRRPQCCGRRSRV